MSDDAHALAEHWVEEVRNWKWDEAYLQTLPPDERNKQEAAHKKQKERTQ